MRRNLLLLAAAAPLLTGTSPALANNHPCSTASAAAVDFNCYADFSTPPDGVNETFCQIWVYTDVTGGFCVFPDSNNSPEDAGGFTCGFTSTNDPSGVVNQDPNAQFGEMNGGPWTAADITGDENDTVSLPDMTIHCWIQINNATPAHAPISTAHCDFTGTGAASGTCQIAYSAGPTDNVYLCTQVDIADDDGTETFVYDDDGDAANGNQCGLPISAEGTRADAPCYTVDPGPVIREEYCF